MSSITLIAQAASGATPRYELPIGPTIAWLLASVASMLIVSLAFGVYVYYRRRLTAVLGESKSVADLASAKERLQADIDLADKRLNEARSEVLALDAERENLARLRGEVVQLKEEAAVNRSRADKAYADFAQATQATAGLKEERVRLQKDVDELLAARSANEKYRQVLHDYEMKSRQLEQMEREVAAKSSQRAALLGELGVLEERTKKMREELASVQTSLSQTNENLAQAKTMLISARQAEEESKRRRSAIDALREEQENLEQRCHKLRKECDALGGIVTNLRTEHRDLTGGKEEPDLGFGDLFTSPPPCLSRELFPDGEHDTSSEYDMLQYVKAYMRTRGFIFHPRVVNAFHTSLKIGHINPITVLAGISGTGKSQLPLQYAEAMGVPSLVVSVQPGWDSPQDLLGFYNYIERKYKPTPLARALVRMDPYNGDGMLLQDETCSDRLLLVLLDEMNLARVEYYFSEFLSKLELRRSCESADAPKRAPAELRIETSTAGAGARRHRIWVDYNVLFVGTMNEDESTQSLSDKILDRANILRFGKPPDNIDVRSETQASAYKPNHRFLTRDTWTSWRKHASQENHMFRRTVDAWITRLNDLLDEHGRPFGHRVRESIIDYVVNYPGVTEPNVYKDAFADQVEQKIIPRLRGLDVADASPMLAEFEDVLMDIGDNELTMAFQECRQQDTSGLFVWRGVTRT